jgi:hypothetical protein
MDSYFCSSDYILRLFRLDMSLLSSEIFYDAVQSPSSLLELTHFYILQSLCPISTTDMCEPLVVTTDMYCSLGK